MSEFRGIPGQWAGSKYTTEQGFTAIKNGVKAREDRRRVRADPKPPWLKARLPAGERFEDPPQQPCALTVLQPSARNRSAPTSANVGPTVPRR